MSSQSVGIGSEAGETHVQLVVYREDLHSGPTPNRHDISSIPHRCPVNSASLVAYGQKRIEY